jgi:hypothetical protein
MVPEVAAGALGITLDCLTTERPKREVKMYPFPLKISYVSLANTIDYRESSESNLLSRQQ